jgi:hypothetical protein
MCYLPYTTYTHPSEAETNPSLGSYLVLLLDIKAGRDASLVRRDVRFSCDMMHAN